MHRCEFPHGMAQSSVVRLVRVPSADCYSHMTQQHPRDISRAQVEFSLLSNAPTSLRLVDLLHQLSAVPFESRIHDVFHLHPKRFSRFCSYPANA